MALEEEAGSQQRAVLRELTDIESKVIWELENWKRAEEARFRYNLKQREAEFIEKLKAEWRQKEIDRDKVVSCLLLGFQRNGEQDCWPYSKDAGKA